MNLCMITRTFDCIRINIFFPIETVDIRHVRKQFFKDRKIIKCGSSLYCHLNGL